MTNNNIQVKTRNLYNTIKTSNRIKLRMHEGILTGNIIEEKPKETCLYNSLDFSCQENSQYIPAV